ncbi:signal peptide peptidase SppA [Seongchinamella sediminis]|uniref:Signal peptide peptidase SppA n=1 Tax=Seongchinamella sediminis TaxID=2283635 RepID=A0A3L7DXC1_9GAMM|nr:signal peptide peptidase SppA [Seongchinamella sediminis]RLQ21974.1 signal peptide peptidase SppA [Seongchinamella sediminis]
MSKPSLLRRIFGGIWRAITYVRLALANILFLLMLAVIYFVYFGGSPEPLPEKAALLLNPMGQIVDQKSPVDPLQALLGEPTPADHEVLLRDVIDAIELAERDDAINALVMELDYLMYAGISRSQEIVAALTSFRASGKPIVAVGDFFTQDQYLLASYADELISHPMGGVALEGFSVYHNYYAEALDKLSVSMHVFRAGQHKSAVEPLIRSDMSAGEKEVALDWLQDLWGNYTTIIEQNRQLAPGAVDDYVNGFAAAMTAGDGDSARLALEAGLVDQLMTRTAANDYLAGVVGARNDEGLYEAVPFEKYLSRKRPMHLSLDSQPRVAVITAQGNMLPGDQPPGTIGADSLSRLIRTTADRPGVEAIVLRVNTPGGSMFASEIIRQQILEVRSEGTPVVVSMGAMAASGGYYIAAAADEIVATANTITGSIGVFAAFPTLENLLQRGGIYTDGVGTTPLAGSLRLDRPLNPQLAQSLDAGVAHAYQVFLQIVADGRQMPLDEVAAVAEGRVWSAGDALELGLVDQLGGLDAAIEAAAARAELADYEVQYVEPRLSPSELILRQFAERVGGLGLIPRSDSVATLAGLARPLLGAADMLSSLQDPRHMFMRCLGCTEAIF